MTVNVHADLKLRTEDDLVLTTIDACDGYVQVGEKVNVVDVRDGVRHKGHVEKLYEAAGHVLLAIDDAPSRMERFRSQFAFNELLRESSERARAIYDTGDRVQSNLCIRQHLNYQDLTTMRRADRYQCPVCGHLLKDRGLAG